MSRELKFRFFTPDKRMIEDHTGWIEDVGINEAIEASIGYGYKIMQFTGMQDKEGKPIYEGDILSDWTETEDGMEQSFCQVFFHEGAWCLDLSYKNDKSFSETLYNELKNYEYEITGNIFENPDLLNQKP